MLFHRGDGAVTIYRLFLAALALGFALASVALASPATSITGYVRQFEAAYGNVRTLDAEFVQSYYAWGRTRVESGAVYLARGGKMRWDYRKPQKKIFLTRGKNLLAYFPSENELRISSLRDTEDAPVPLDLLISHIQLSRFFSHIEFAPQSLEAAPGDRVIRAYPRKRYRNDYRDCLMELSPSFDIRKLVIFYLDGTTMQFEFTHIRRNPPLKNSLFAFTPPPGTKIIRPF